MKIKEILFERYDLQLAKSYTIAYETIEHSTNFVVKFITDTGIVGFGCSAPDIHVTGESPSMVEEILKDHIIPYFTGKNPLNYLKWLHELKLEIPQYSSVRAMVDMALLDIFAKKADVPLYQFLGGFRNKIETSITVGILDVKETLEETKEYQEQGFNIIKVKGGHNVEDDIERMIKLREVFPHLRLRFDGNQGYSTQESIHFYNQTKDVAIEIFEQPTKVENENRLFEVKNQVDIPLMADESVKSIADTYRLVVNDKIDMINIKLMKVGGIMEATHINAIAKANKIEAMIGCNDECSLGIAAGLHFALSKPNIEFADLDGHLEILKDPFPNIFKLEKGWLYPSQKPGLGI